MGGRGTIWAALLAVAAVLFVAAPARAAAIYVELSPETVQAGYLVGIRASCDDNSQPATVESDAFGEVKVYPQFEVLTAAVTVPADKDARRYTVRLRCAGGETATARLNVLASGQPSEGRPPASVAWPMTAPAACWSAAGSSPSRSRPYSGW
ncbi:hypothetical protein [Phytohabitans rumicis]|uniref:Uncharacterized protein n=1 Tax=Phytohabitans rumicis TaxID=1076125 RepID=A0A6V8LCP2_9ACTN|nr:hypothetical protein [Phytohabitans rumicis]GFJ92758.1 hypothetical protein Prum_064000 [Phytohabitans rumicis]